MSVHYPISKKNIVKHCVLFVFFTFGLLTNIPSQAQNKSPEKSFFKSALMNMEAAANETFRYNTTLHNGTSETKIYQLQAQIPEGWSITFTTMGSPVTSIQIEAGKTQDITVEIHARPDSKPSKYAVPLTATATGDNLTLNLEAVLKGAYGVELTTPTGRLSDDITEGSSKQVRLVIRNSGTLTLDNLELSGQAPTNWEVSFEPSKIERLEAGQSREATATIKVPGKTIAGDYITTLTAKNANANANATFRMTVKTSLLSGWIGIMVILLAIGLVYYLIRKYGRR